MLGFIIFHLKWSQLSPHNRKWGQFSKLWTKATLSDHVSAQAIEFQTQRTGGDKSLEPIASTYHSQSKHAWKKSSNALVIGELWAH